MEMMTMDVFPLLEKLESPDREVQYESGGRGRWAGLLRLDLSKVLLFFPSVERKFSLHNG